MKLSSDDDISISSGFSDNYANLECSRKWLSIGTYNFGEGLGISC